MKHRHIGDLKTTTELELQRALRWSPCCPTTFQNFLQDGRIKRIPRGECLFRPGTFVNQLVLVVEGVLRTAITSPDSKHRAISYFGPGHILPLIPFFDQERNGLECVAHADMWILTLDRTTVDNAMASDPGFARNIVKMLCDRGRRIYVTLAAETILPAGQRCAQTLLSLCQDFGVETPEGIVLGLRLSQEELASAMGFTRPTTNRLLKEFVEVGAVKLAYSKITVTNLPKLQAMAQGELVIADRRMA